MEGRSLDAQAPSERAQIVACNLLLEVELIRVVDALANGGVDALVLKGIPLARSLFGRIDHRPIDDNDILVRRDDVVKAATILAKLGYQSRPFDTLDARSGLDFQWTLSRRLPNSAIVFCDLHWNAFVPYLFPVPEEALWRRTTTFLLQGRTIRVFDRDMSLIHLAAHFAQHSFNQPRILNDFAAAWNLWGEATDLHELTDLAARLGLSHVLTFAFLMAAELGLLTAEPPLRSKRARLLRWMLPANRLSEPRPEFDYYRAALAFLLADPRNVARWLMRHAWPDLHYLSALYAQPVSGRLYFRYLTRPLRPVARLFGRNPRF